MAAGKQASDHAIIYPFYQDGRHLIRCAAESGSEDPALLLGAALSYCRRVYIF